MCEGDPFAGLRPDEFALRARLRRYQDDGKLSDAPPLVPWKRVSQHVKEGYRIDARNAEYHWREWRCSGIDRRAYCRFKARIALHVDIFLRGLTEEEQAWVETRAKTMSGEIVLWNHFTQMLVKESDAEEAYAEYMYRYDHAKERGDALPEIPMKPFWQEGK